MAEDVDRPNKLEPPKLPSPMHALAVLLELGILVTFVAERSIVGIALCVAYAWFSATRAIFSGVQ